MGIHKMTDTIWIHCNLCSGKKKHEILFHKEIEWSDDIANDLTIHGSNIYDLLKCCGCESVQFRKQSWHSEERNPETGKPEIYIKCYPPPTFRESPRWLRDYLPFWGPHENFWDLIREIYIALQNDAPRLAVLGIRALLELIMIDKVGDQGSFKKNLNEFQNKGFISQKQKEIIEIVLEVGHAAMHRSYIPSKKDVVPLMDITESIFEMIYINESKSKGIGKKVPKRKK